MGGSFQGIVELRPIKPENARRESEACSVVLFVLFVCLFLSAVLLSNRLPLYLRKKKTIY